MPKVPPDVDATMPGVEVRSDGSKVVMTSQGKMTIGPDGSMTLEANNGDYVTQVGGVKTTEKPDGTIIVEKEGLFGKKVEQINPDGTREEQKPFLESMMTGVLFGVAAAGAYKAQNQALSGHKPFALMHDAALAINAIGLGADMDRKPAPAPSKPKPTLSSMLGM